MVAIFSGRTYWRPFDAPFCTCPAAGVSTSAISKFDVFVAGRGYIIDTAQLDRTYFASIPMLKALFLQDRGTTPIGEHSLNPSDYWRRSVDDWSAGAGQKALDHATSTGNQYRISKGIDPWTIGEFGMLNDTTLSNAVAAPFAVFKLVMSGTTLYVLADNALSFGSTSSQTAVTATGGDAALSNAIALTSDGFTQYVADSTRVHYTTRNSTTFTKYHTSDHVATLLKSTKGRLLSANGATLYTHSGAAGSAVATSFFVNANSDWVWTDITGGPDAIYFSGFSGDKSRIYASTIKSDATALDAPVVVATLPSGELVQSMFEYLGILCIGTSKGLRFATITSGGGLTLGGLLSMANPPTCFEGQDRFVWFGWTDYDTVSTGLGRADLSTLNPTDLFAYASDLMATGQGNVTAVVTSNNLRVFAVLGLGLFVQSANKVPSATIKSGWLNYALAENKLAIKAVVQNRAGEGSYALDLAIDDLPSVPVGNVIDTLDSVGNSETIVTPQLQGRSYEFGLTLNRSPNDLTDAPVIDRWTLMVEPQPERRAQFKPPLLLHSSQKDRLNSTVVYDPAEERRHFFNLMQSRSIVPFQDREQTYNVIIDDIEWQPYQHVGANRVQGSWDGTLIPTLKIVN